ncbi:MAG: hypothetical protein LUQ11_05275 [Methylococcaceae bacterium]|nr:hypothetical protein [Methylococcaceae bacterium]
MKEYAKEYRGNLLKKLSRKKSGSKPSEVLEAEKIIAKYNEEQEKIGPQLFRLESSECPDSICPQCFYLRGLNVHLKTIPGDDEIDKYQCPECNSIYEE